MNFTEKYTTDSVIAKIEDAELLKVEREKILLSNDAYAIGQLLETLINRGLG